MAKSNRNRGRRHNTPAAQSSAAKSQLKAEADGLSITKPEASKDGTASGGVLLAPAYKVEELVTKGAAGEEAKGASLLPDLSSGSPCAAPGPKLDLGDGSMSGSGHSSATATQSWDQGEGSTDLTHSHVIEGGKFKEPPVEAEASGGLRDVDLNSSVSSLTSAGSPPLTAWDDVPAHPAISPLALPVAGLMAPPQHVPPQQPLGLYTQGQHDGHHEAAYHGPQPHHTFLAHPGMTTSPGFDPHYAPQHMHHQQQAQQWQPPHAHNFPVQQTQAPFPHHMHHPQHDNAAIFYPHVQHHHQQQQQHMPAFYGQQQPQLHEVYGPQSQPQQQGMYLPPGPSMHAHHNGYNGYQGAPMYNTQHSQHVYPQHDNTPFQANGCVNGPTHPYPTHHCQQQQSLHQTERDWHYPGELDPTCNYIHTPYGSFRKADVYNGLVSLPLPTAPTMMMASTGDQRRGKGKGRGGKGYRGRKSVVAY